MSLHTFNAKITLPDGRYGKLMKIFEKEQHPYFGASLEIKPTFTIGDTPKKVGVITMMSVTESDFAGIHFIGDEPKQAEVYAALLRQAGIHQDYVDAVSMGNLETHLIAGTHTTLNEFMTTSVVRARIPVIGEDAAQAAFDNAVKGSVMYDKVWLRPEQVYDIASMLRPTR